MSYEEKLDPGMLDDLPALHEPTLDFVRTIIEQEFAKEITPRDDELNSQIAQQKAILEDPDSSVAAKNEANRAIINIWVNDDREFPQLFKNILSRMDVDGLEK